MYRSTRFGNIFVILDISHLEYLITMAMKLGQSKTKLKNYIITAFHKNDQCQTVLINSKSFKNERQMNLKIKLQNNIGGCE